jgi:tRNA pseudouridine13 synthase
MPESDRSLPPSPAHAQADFDPHVTPALYLTGDLPPLGGWIKERPEDFLVDEQPAYQPSGEGEHLYLFIEKRGLSTLRASRILAQHFGVHERAIGYAGLKDKQAVTRQVFSVHIPGRKLEDFPSLQHERMGVLWADYHANKLRPGHLAGNRFSIRIRGVQVRDVLVAQRALARLEKVGVPNRFGEQRFGYRLRNHVVGRALLRGDAAEALDALLAPVPGLADQQDEGRAMYQRGDYAGALHAFFRESRTERRVLGELSRGASPGKAVRAIDRSERDFFLTAFQSAVFNTVLDERLREGLLGEVRDGDLAFKHDSGAVFAVGAADVGPTLAARAAAFEVSPSGPLWGAETMRASGAAGERELAALAAAGVTPEQIDEYAKGHGGRPSGARRPLRVRLSFPEVEGGADEHGTYIRVAFDLPRGAFATTVIREIIKPPAGRGLVSQAGEAEELE